MSQQQISPTWMITFGDISLLALSFFVLRFSMLSMPSTVPTTGGRSNASLGSELSREQIILRDAFDEMFDAPKEHNESSGSFFYANDIELRVNSKGTTIFVPGALRERGLSFRGAMVLRAVAKVAEETKQSALLRVETAELETAAAATLGLKESGLSDERILVTHSFPAMGEPEKLSVTLSGLGG